VLIERLFDGVVIKSLFPWSRRILDGWSLVLIRRGSRVAQSGLRRIRCGKDGLIPHLEGMARLAIVLVALAGLLLLRFVSGDKIYHLSEVSCKQRCLPGQVDEAGIAPPWRLMAYLHRGLTALPLQLVRHEAIGRQLPQQLVQTQGLGLVLAQQIEVACAPPSAASWQARRSTAEASASSGWLIR
jgi:hypothetical protein